MKFDIRTWNDSCCDFLFKHQPIQICPAKKNRRRIQVAHKFSSLSRVAAASLFEDPAPAKALAEKSDPANFWALSCYLNP